MNHTKKREGTNPRTKRGTIQFTLRWKREGTPTFDSSYHYFGNTMDANYTFNQFRHRCIQQGIRKGQIFCGEIRTSPEYGEDGQIRMPLGHNQEYVLLKREDTTLLLYNLHNNTVEDWVKKDKASGFVIEYRGYGYQFAFGVNNESLLAEDAKRKLDVLRRIHEPTKDQTKPIELIEHEVYDPLHSDMHTLIGEEGFQTFKQTGIAPIPVPSREELEAVTNLVVIAARNDEGKVVPTAAYYAMNPMRGEIVETVMQADDNMGMAKVIATYFMQDPKTALDRFEVIMQGVAAHIKQGSKYDWLMVNTLSKMYVEDAQNENNESRKGIKAAIEDIAGRMTIEQNNDYSGKSLFKAVHLVTQTAVNEAAHNVISNDPETLCSTDDKPVKSDRFVGLDQFNQVGAPPFSPICGDCIKALEGTRLGQHIAGKGQGQFIVDKHLKVLGRLQDGTVVPAETLFAERPVRNVVDESYPEGTPEEVKGGVRDARVEFENWVTDSVMSPDPKAKSFYYFDHKALALFFYRNVKAWGENSRPIVHHWLGESGSHKVISTGSDYYPSASNWDDPTGIRSAMEYLAFYELGHSDVEDAFWRDWRKDLAYHDQHGNRVPKDLILIPDYNIALDDEGFYQAINNTAWYEIGGYLFIAWSAIKDQNYLEDPLTLDEFDMVNVLEDPITRIDDVLKRGTNEDGWYSA
jgi:hypothetical protein